MSENVLSGKNGYTLRNRMIRAVVQGIFELVRFSSGRLKILRGIQDVLKSSLSDISVYFNSFHPHFTGVVPFFGQT